MSAYVSEEVDSFLAEGLYATLTNVDFDADALLALSLKAGSMTIAVMDLLKRAHNETFGEMQPVTVPMGTVKGPGLDFSELIEKARSLPELPDRPGDAVLSTGYSDNVVLPLSASSWSAAAMHQARTTSTTGSSLPARPRTRWC